MTHPFDHRPDDALGRLLREGLGPDGHEAFVARVSGALAADARGAPWSVLATWLRPGLAAAGIAALAVLGLSMAGGVAALPATFAEVAVAAGVPEVLITAAPGPTPDLLLSAVVEGR